MDSDLKYFAIGRVQDQKLLLQYCIDKKVKIKQDEYSNAAANFLLNEGTATQVYEQPNDTWFCLFDSNGICFLLCTAKNFDRQTADSLLAEVTTEIYDKFNEIKTNPQGDITLSGARVLLMDIFVKYLPTQPKIKNVERMSSDNSKPVSNEKGTPDKINVQH
jgi:hypothetical protein